MTAFQVLQGDPHGIEQNTDAMARVAEAMTQAASALRALNAGDYVSAAVDKAAANTQDVAGDLDDCSERYGGAADALRGYAAALRSAQESVVAANNEAAGLDVPGARYRVDELSHTAHNVALNPTTSPDERQQVLYDLALAKQHLAAQEEALAHASGAVAAALQDLDTAARQAADRIQDAIRSSSLNDSLVYDVTSWGADRLKQLEKWYEKDLLPFLNDVAKLAGDLADLLSWVGVVLALIPGLQALSGLLEAVSLALNAFEFAVKLLDFFNGDLTLGALVGATIGIVITVVTSKVGGRIARNLLRGGKAGRGVAYAMKMEKRIGKGELTHTINMLKPGLQHDKEAALIAKKGLQWGDGAKKLAERGLDYAQHYDLDQTQRVIDGEPLTPPMPPELPFLRVPSDITKVAKDLLPVVGMVCRPMPMTAMA